MQFCDRASGARQVGVRPALPALTVEAVPPSLRGAVQLSAHLHPSQWDRISHATLRAANFRCLPSLFCCRLPLRLSRQ